MHFSVIRKVGFTEKFLILWNTTGILNIVSFGGDRERGSGVRCDTFSYKFNGQSMIWWKV